MGEYYKGNSVRLNVIVKILCQDNTLIKSWKRFSHSLRVDETQLFALEQRYSNGTVEPYDLIYAVMNLWMKLPNYVPTVKQLMVHLDKMNLQNLIANLNKEFSPEAVIDNKPLIWNGSKWWPWKMKLVKSFMQRKEGDDLIVNKLHEMLTHREGDMNKATKHQLVISGLGGVGKTTLAKWYADYYNDYYDYIVWLDCEDSELHNSLVGLVASLNISVQTPNPTVTELVTEIFRFFDQHKSLFIFDNVGDYSGINGAKHFMPHRQHEQTKYHIIITSRSKIWGQKTGFGPIPQYQLNVFTKDDSLRFIKKHLIMTEKVPKHIIVQLCELLGNLPLALQIAVATLNEGNVNILDMIQNIRSSNDFVRKNQHVDDYEMSIFHALRVSMDRINSYKECGELSLNVLAHFGYLPPDNISLVYFSSLINETTYKLTAAAELLEKFSLVSISTTDKYDVKLISIHRLLQQVIKEVNKEKEVGILFAILSQRSPLNREHIKILPCLAARKHPDLKIICEKVMRELISVRNLEIYLHSNRFEDAYNLSHVHLIYFQGEVTYPLTSEIAEKICQSQSKEFAVLWNHGLICYKCEKFQDALKYFEFLKKCRIFLEKHVSMSDKEVVTLDLNHNLAAAVDSSDKQDCTMALPRTEREKPDYILEVLITHLVFYLNTFEAGNIMTSNQILEKRERVHISVGYFDLKLYFIFLGLINTNELTLTGGQIYQNIPVNITEMLPYSPKRIRLSNTKFIDKEGNQLSEVNFLQALPRSEELILTSVGTTIRNLSASYEKLEIINTSVDFNSANYHLINLKYLKIVRDQFSENPEQLWTYLKHCSKLVTLVLHMRAVEIQAGSFPRTLKNLIISGVTIVYDSCSSPALKLDNFKMQGYSLTNILETCPKFKSKTFIFEDIIGISTENYQILSEILEICKHTFIIDVYPLKASVKQHGIQINTPGYKKLYFVSSEDYQKYEFVGKLGKLLRDYYDSW